MEYIFIIIMVLILFFFLIWCIGNLINDCDNLSMAHKLLRSEVIYLERTISEMKEEIKCLKESVDALIREVG